MKENKSKILSILLFVSNGSIYLYPIPFYVFHSMYFPLRVCPPIPCIPFYVSHFVYPNPCISHSPYASPMRVPSRFIDHISCNPCISHSPCVSPMCVPSHFIYHISCNLCIPFRLRVCVPYVYSIPCKSHPMSCVPLRMYVSYLYLIPGISLCVYSTPFIPFRVSHYLCVPLRV